MPSACIFNRFLVGIPLSGSASDVSQPAKKIRIAPNTDAYAVATTDIQTYHGTDGCADTGPITAAVVQADHEADGDPDACADAHPDLSPNARTDVQADADADADVPADRHTEPSGDAESDVRVRASLSCCRWARDALISPLK